MYDKIYHFFTTGNNFCDIFDSLHQEPSKMYHIRLNIKERICSGLEVKFFPLPADPIPDTNTFPRISSKVHGLSAALNGLIKFSGFIRNVTDGVYSAN